MASYGWRFFRDYQAWSDQSRLFIRFSAPKGETKFITGLTITEVPEGARMDEPALSEGREDVQDGVGDVTGFLQAALDCAWEAGLRPRGFADTANELKAVRYHLEDMRSLAKVPRQT